MDWNQVWTIVGANIALALISIGMTVTLFLWARTEANQDRRQIASQRDEDRRELSQLVKEIQNEMKDFHKQLLEIQKQIT